MSLHKERIRLIRARWNARVEPHFAFLDSVGWDESNMTPAERREVELMSDAIEDIAYLLLLVEKDDDDDREPMPSVPPRTKLRLVKG